MAKQQLVSTGRIGEWAFLAGLLLAIVLGIFQQALAAGTVTLILVVLGIVVGLLNIAVKEAHNFLLVVVALLVAGSAGLGVLPAVGTYLAVILANIVSFVAPAAVIVAVKAVYELARKK